MHLDKSSFTDIFDFRMTIFVEASCQVVERRFPLRTRERLIGRQELLPGEYTVGHGPVTLNLKVDKSDNKDSLSLNPKSIKPINRGVGFMEFAGSGIFPVGLLAEEITIVPEVGKPALRLGPDQHGLTLSLVSLPENALNLIEPIGQIMIEKAIVKKKLGG